MHTGAGTGSALESELELPPWAERLLLVYWWLFALAVAIVVPDEPARLEPLSWAARALVSPLAPLIWWFALRAARAPLERALRALPARLRFGFVAALAGLALGLRFVAPLGAALWLARFGVALAAWCALARRWAFSYHHVFWFSGFAFALGDENQQVVRCIGSGDWLGASLSLAYLIPLYGLPLAAPFMLAPRELNAPAR